MADEDLVLDRHAFADEGVGGDLAANADMAVLLDLDEGADLRSVTDRTPVQIHEIGVGEDRLGTKLNVPERHCPEHLCLLALSQSGNGGKTKVQFKLGVHAVPLDSPSGGTIALQEAECP